MPTLLQRPTHGNLLFGKRPEFGGHFSVQYMRFQRTLVDGADHLRSFGWPEKGFGLEPLFCCA